MVRREGVDVVLLALERALVGADRLDALAEAVLSDRRDDLCAVLLLGVHPPRGLVEGLRGHRAREDLVHLRDRLGDGGAGLPQLGDEFGIVEDAAGHLAVAAAEA
eukprot:CAMPEP_0175460874 /NCGR_PEP_ID=MMETSP0095-20121207/67869_1 /TAXON_ID=311494 /ORGANISM="Alexandrium monilatum, Strain CCMP3105" /LENGTH=104 /DNA_ID=CAMNT_0016761909 /DNA_START=282 /DNA_END=596 /DNA_ORIENTATION=+